VFLNILPLLFCPLKKFELAFLALTRLRPFERAAVKITIGFEPCSLVNQPPGVQPSEGLAFAAVPASPPARRDLYLFPRLLFVRLQPSFFQPGGAARREARLPPGLGVGLPQMAALVELAHQPLVAGRLLDFRVAALSPRRCQDFELLPYFFALVGHREQLFFLAVIDDHFVGVVRLGQILHVF
jgi:hypothetical protein